MRALRLGLIPVHARHLEILLAESLQELYILAQVYLDIPWIPYTGHVVSSKQAMKVASAAARPVHQHRLLHRREGTSRCHEDRAGPVPKAALWPLPTVVVCFAFEV